MQRSEEEMRRQQRLRDKEREAYNLILKDSDEAMAGRAWLILMTLMTAVIHAYVKRNGIHSDSDVEDFDMLELIDEIIADFEKQLNGEVNEEEYLQKEEIIDALKVTRRSRNILGHNHKFYDLTEYIEWTDAWIKSAQALLANSQRNQKESIQDGRRIQQLKRACDALKCPGKRDKTIKDSFRFALAETSYAKAARAYFIQTTIVHPALKECAALHILIKDQKRYKDMSQLLHVLLNKSTSFLQGRDILYLERLFFGKENGSLPQDIDGDGIKECRNILAHNTQCTTREDTKYIEMLYLWKALLIEINSSSKYFDMLDKAANYLFDVDWY